MKEKKDVFEDEQYFDDEQSNNINESAITKQELDTLDAFMNSIVKEMNLDKKIPDNSIKEIMYSEDPTETYYKAIKNQIKNDLRNVGQSRIENNEDDLLLLNQENDRINEIVDSEGEIDIDRWKELKKKSVEPLPFIDHSKREYEEINKCFYLEDPEISNLTPAEINKIRKDKEIKVRGCKVTNPVTEFSHLRIDEPILKKIEKLGLIKPTPIQCQAIPAGLEGRDIIGIAKTGSGKTLAYIIPMIMHLLDQRQLEKNEGPIAIVIAPMRELCQQINIEVKKYANLFNLNVATIIGGENKTDQWKDIKYGSEIMIATPGRLIDLVRKGAFELNSRCSFLVLDEVDKMFEMGFEYQIRSIINQIRPDRQILMFSATLKKKIENLVKDISVDPVKIFVGKQGASNEDVTQFCFVLDSDNDKWKFLAENLEFYLEQGQVLIFANQIGTVELLFKNLESVYNGKVGIIHGNKAQYDRTVTINHFKQGKYLILVATDLASRGLDIPMIRTIINYDCANDNETHIHRIGRTGRAGDKDGYAITLISNEDSKSASMLLRNFELSGQVITPKLEKLALSDSSLKNKRMKIGIGKYNITVNINKKSKSLRQLVGQTDRKGVGYKAKDDDSESEENSDQKKGKNEKQNGTNQFVKIPEIDIKNYEIKYNLNMVSNENKAFQKKEIQHENHTNDYFKNLINPNNIKSPQQVRTATETFNGKDDCLNNNKLVQFISDMNNQEMFTLGPVNNTDDSYQHPGLKTVKLKEDTVIKVGCNEKIPNLIDSEYNQEEGPMAARMNFKTSYADKIRENLGNHFKSSFVSAGNLEVSNRGPTVIYSKRTKDNQKTEFNKSNINLNKKRKSNWDI